MSLRCAHTDLSGAVWLFSSFGIEIFAGPSDVSSCSAAKFVSLSSNSLLVSGDKINNKLILRAVERGCNLILYRPLLDRANFVIRSLASLASPEAELRVAGSCKKWGGLDESIWRMTLSEGSELGKLVASNKLVQNMSDYVDWVDFKSLGLFLADLRQPRWFLDPKRPLRCSRLFAWAGVTPFIVSKWLRNEPMLSSVEQRCDWWLSAWKKRGVIGKGFLAKEELKFDAEKGVLRAAQKLLKLLVVMWLAEEKDPLVGDFSPVRFFKGER